MRWISLADQLRAGDVEEKGSGARRERAEDNESATTAVRETEADSADRPARTTRAHDGDATTMRQRLRRTHCARALAHTLSRDERELRRDGGVRADLAAGRDAADLGPHVRVTLSRSHGEGPGVPRSTTDLAPRRVVFALGPHKYVVRAVRRVAHKPREA